MKLETIKLWPDGEPQYTLTRYIREGEGADLIRPAMLVVPGGAYAVVCEATEGGPVADAFAALGFNVFVLHYHVHPTKYPEPQQDIFRAIRLMRHNARAWRINPNNIAAVGFSAGGHLVASAATRFNDVTPPGIDAADTESARPDAAVLAYPVITLGAKTHSGTASNICDSGAKLEEWRDYLSMEKHVPKDAVPTFLWHTLADEAVPYENSLMFMKALHKKGIPTELHLFPFGQHGMQLGYGNEDLTEWPKQACRFLKVAAGFHFPEVGKKHKVYLTFDDAVKSHLTVVAPILQKYHLTATFFICRFSDEWRREHEEALLTAEEIKQLSQMGFTIGNHTWSHPDLSALNARQIDGEIAQMNQFLADAGTPAPTTFAYPGGPYNELTASILKIHGITWARTTEHGYITAETDALRIPAWPMQGECFEHFKEVVDATEPGKAVCIVFHGVPDMVHRHVHTEPSVFERCMQYLSTLD